LALGAFLIGVEWNYSHDRDTLIDRHFDFAKPVALEEAGNLLDRNTDWILFIQVVTGSI